MQGIYQVSIYLLEIQLLKIHLTIKRHIYSFQIERLI